MRGRRADARARAVSLIAVAAFTVALGASLVVPMMPTARAATTWHVYTVNYRFLPASITIQPGDTVVWTNNVTTEHTVTSLSSPAAWTEIILSTQGSNGQVTFNTPGVYPYECSIHYLDGMVGSVTVAGGIPEFSSSLAVVMSMMALVIGLVFVRRRL